MFNSIELNNAVETPSSITHLTPTVIDVNLIKNSIKTAVLLKGENLLAPYESGNLNRTNTKSSGESLKHILSCAREQYLLNYKGDDIKCLIIKKLFDNIYNNLDCLMASGIDTSSDEINSSILGFLNKNFL